MCRKKKKTVKRRRHCDVRCGLFSVYFKSAVRTGSADLYLYRLYLHYMMSLFFHVVVIYSLDVCEFFHT